MPSSSPQPVTQNTSSKTEPWDAQQPYIKKGLSEYERLYNQGPFSMYSGALTAPTDPATTNALNATESRAMAGSPILGAAKSEMGKTLAGDYLNPASNPAWGSMVDTIKANVLPGIDSRFIGAGRSGSGLHGRAVGEGLGSAVGQLAYQNYGDERNRMASAAANAPNFAAADYLDPQALAGVGAQREAIAQKGVDEAVARHDYAQAAPADALSRYMQGIQGNYGSTTSGTTTSYLPPQNIFSQVLGGLMGGVGTLGQTGAFGKTGWMFSDERLKEDIKRVGETDDGLPIYTYSYKAGGPPMMGVMAQDVAKVKPEAVARDPSGYLAVNYGAL